MKKIARFLVKNPKMVLLPCILLTVVSIVVTGLRFSLNADIASFMKDGSESGEEYAALEKKYSTNDPIQILTSLPDDSTYDSVENLGHLADFMSEVASVKGVASVSSFLPLTDPLTGTDLEYNSTKILNWKEPVVKNVLDSTMASLLLSKDRQHTLLMAVPCSTCSGLDVATALILSLQEIATKDQDPSVIKDRKLPGNIRARLSGNPVIFATVIQMLTCVFCFTFSSAAVCCCCSCADASPFFTSLSSTALCSSSSLPYCWVSSF